MKYRILMAVLLFGLRAAAQQTAPGLAASGAKGIFVSVGMNIQQEKGPVKAYRIERKAGDEKEFREMTTLQPVRSPEEFRQHMQQSLQWLPYAQDLSIFRADSIFKKGMATGSLVKLRQVAAALPVVAGFNMLWLDEKVETGKVYQYRVTALGTDTVYLSLPITVKAPALHAPRFARASYNQPEQRMQLEWIASGPHKPAVLELYRREQEKDFVRVAARLSAVHSGDTLQFFLKDTTAVPGRLYQYYVRAFDVLGNEAPLSDTILQASLDPVQLPMPQQVKAMADSLHRGIRISWQLADAGLVKSLRLFRSTNSVTGYTEVAVLSGDATEYLDQRVQPAIPYFYHFSVDYKMLDSGRRSTGFGASWQDPLPPMAPALVEAEGNKEGVAISWQYDARQVRGFQLYRAERGRPLQLIVPLIPYNSRSSLYSFTDQDSALNGARDYQYALKALSTSHLASAFSDTAAARPGKNIPLPKPPMDLRAISESDQVLLTWEAVSNYDELVNGYKLLRSHRVKGSAGNYATDTIYCSGNLFRDSLVNDRETYRYSVVSVSVLGVQSSPAAWVSAELPLVRPTAPAGLMANRVKDGIQLDWNGLNEGDILSYTVYRYERAGTIVKAGTVSNGQERFVDKSAARGKKYFYYVCSFSADGKESMKSNEAVVNY
ncbi:MAG: hypothetical protein P0Y53_13115 [Candidatus Pseudobacter hemicellulosilyticus]|uniref:Fibronectin type 3 domain-containing protein n=1 Tax=Candidatus Pseudobacter hemicellulosilyticus TaxID=3121375 RepID=A0AAJ6BD97_9BACT|nr:MAG: hypothetical protein P0Y53_13115 [Pseudobacter sp.]